MSKKTTSATLERFEEELTKRRLKMFESGELDERYRDVEAPQDLTPKISELVCDAVDKIELYAVPYFAEVAKGQGG